MKKILLGMLALALVFPASAQFRSGSFTVGGNVRFANVSGWGDNSAQLMIAPELGYMASKKVQIGVLFNYEYAKNAYVYTMTGYGEYNQLDMFGVGAFVRGFFPIVERVSFALAGGVQYLAGTNKVDYWSGPEKYDLSGVGVSIRPEFWFHITRGTSLTAGLGDMTFTSIKSKYESTDVGTTNTFNLNWSSVTLGAAFAF